MNWNCVVRLSLLTSAVLLYYGWGIKTVGKATRPAGRRLLGRPSRIARYTADEVESVVGLLAASTGQVVFLAIALAITGVSLSAIIRGNLDPLLLPLAAVLGVGEASLASYVGYIGMATAQAVAGGPSDSYQWVVMGRGGWMHVYIRAAEILPWPLLVCLTISYVAVEEVIFRAVIISFLSPYSALAAVTVSTLLFVAVQVFHMPSWRAAMFTAAGGLTVGVVHGTLFLVTEGVVPLIIAHFAMFLVLVR
jgi:membrane protease YdiL (CAAX protease family)